MIINDFDINNMITDYSKNISLLIVGRNDEEKRRVILNIFSNIKVESGIVFSKEQSFYNAFFTNHEYYDEYYDYVLNNKQINSYSCINERSYIIIDNCLQNTQLNAGSSYFKMMMDFRKYNICPMLCTTHEPLNLIPQILYSFDYVVILPECRPDILFELYMIYANIFPTLLEFTSVMNELYIKNECMVVNYKSMSIQINQKIFKLKTVDIRSI